MYESYWQLDAKPFENTVDPRFYYPGESQQAAVLKLRYAIENRRSAALLAGGAGVGKTLLAQSLLRQLNEKLIPRVHLVYPQLPAEQLLAYLADQLTGSSSPANATAEQSLRRIEQRLTENARAGRHAVVVVDEAHLLREARTLETIRLLLNFEYQSQPLMTLLLVGQTSLALAVDRMPELEERLAVKCQLRRLSLIETMGYVQHRLTAAGAQRPVFEEAALEAIHQHAHGVPRRINRLCDLALLVGFAEEVATIGPGQIEAVSAELVGVAAE
jgi:general secretion pathway protein A